MIRLLKNSDKQNFLYFCQSNRDPYSDFYITKDRKRLYLTDINVAKTVFNNCLKRGDQCFVKEEHDNIVAIMLITGFSDGFERKYVKILATNKDGSRDLFRFLQWQKIKNLFIKSRKTNIHFVKYDERTKRYKPSFFARKTGFRIIVVRDKEILLKKEDYKYNQNTRR